MFCFLHQFGANALLSYLEICTLSLSLVLSYFLVSFFWITFQDRSSLSVTLAMCCCGICHDWTYFRIVFSLFYGIIYTFWFVRTRFCGISYTALKISKIALLVIYSRNKMICCENFHKFVQSETKLKKGTSNWHRRTRRIENKYEKFITN